MDAPIEIWKARTWTSDWTAEESARAVLILESGGVLVLPDCSFAFAPEERRFLDARWLDGSRKNIGLDGDAVRGTTARGDDARALAAMVARFARSAATLVERLLPEYAHRIRRAFDAAVTDQRHRADSLGLREVFPARRPIEAISHGAGVQHDAVDAGAAEHLDEVF